MQNNNTELPEQGLTQKDAERIAEAFCRIFLKTAEEQQKRESTSEVDHWEKKKIDFRELFYLLASKIKYIILASVISGALFGVYAFLLLTPEYSATAKLYIMGQNSSSILSDLQVGSYLTMDYQEVFKTWEVHDKVREQLGLDYSYKDMQSMLEVTNPSNTRVLYITIRHKDPGQATDIANAYADAAKEFILDTMDSEAPSTFSLALEPSRAIGIRRGSYIVIGLLLGFFCAVAVIIIRTLLDNYPKTPKDIAKYSGLPTLAIIPIADEATGRVRSKK